MHTERVIALSQRVSADDLDLEAAAGIGLTRDERLIIEYFADIESQTVHYMLDLARTRAGRDPEVLDFLTVWNYEELHHGRSLSQLLTACSDGAPEPRPHDEVRARVRWSEVLEALGARLLSRVAGDRFLTVYQTWGAIQELTTLLGYERLAATSANPALAELSRRIARQERVHFAWYYNRARAGLAASRITQRLTRWLLERFWTPVGEGVKTSQETAQLFASLFPGPASAELARRVDQKIERLPGMKGLRLMRRAAERLSYFPTQNTEKMRPSTSSVSIRPVI